MSNIFKYSRLLFAFILAFGISYFLMSRQYITPTKFDLAAVKDDAQRLVTSISSFHFELPHIQLFSQRKISTPGPDLSAPTNVPIPSMGFENPTSTPFIQPTQRGNYPTLRPSSAVPTTYITTAPEPTKKPKPTKAPDEFPVDPSLQRPGKTVDEMFTIAAQKSCIPKAALRAIASIESGGFFDTVGTKYLILYNSANWWNSEFIPESEDGRIRTCSGWAYDGNTGLIPGDSKNAGKKCRDGSGSGLGVMGVMSSSPREFDLYKGDVAKALGVPVSQVDRRVILDALILTGFAIQKEVHATSCTSWSASQMVKGACSYYGSCGFADQTYYCNTFCRNLKTYGGGDCSGAISQYQTSCWN